MAVTRLTTNGLTGTKYDIASADNYYMEPIATTLLGTATGTITFNNIPQGYKNLQLRTHTKNSGANNQQGFAIYLNGDSAGSGAYSTHYLQGDGAATYSGGGANGGQISWIYAVGSSVASQIFNPSIVDFLDYTHVNKFKTVRLLCGWDYNGGGAISFASACWMNTAPITSIQITHTSNFTANSRFSLYGIKG
jgi:hypothetical protein